ncbi:MAG: hypothetical protein CBB97_11350 [Candidatus Endolissoclinum sp. TMED37]|nr:MAG: hypothetical protein CBB97_11350 [Candidatus Endolissoclinum sp. TMED37]
MDEKLVQQYLNQLNNEVNRLTMENVLLKSKLAIAVEENRAFQQQLVELQEEVDEDADYTSPPKPVKAAKPAKKKVAPVEESLEDSPKQFGTYEG